MPATVSLDDIVEALGLQSEISQTFLNRETGEILACTEEEISLAEEEDDERTPQWQQKMLPKVREALNGKPWLELPTKFEIHEWEIMQRFADKEENEEHRRELLRAIHGNGAFRHFRDTIYRLGIEKRWYRFHDEQLKEVAIEWLEENQIPFSEKKKNQKGENTDLTDARGSSGSRKV
ncbi:MAG TPA: UPF0158 family protein [Terriglobales bacterium]|nr:UPF0158 family protein [Terriglobales bacterium]